MKVYSASLLEVEFDAAQGRMHLICKSNFRSQDFRDSLLAALQFAEKHHAKQWLIDYTAIGNLEEEEQKWLHTQLFPRMMMTMGTGNYVAVVLSNRSYEALLREAGVLGLQSYNSYIIINTFCDADQATAWLRTAAISNAS